jgi:hypothetical protein
VNRKEEAGSQEEKVEGIKVERKVVACFVAKEIKLDIGRLVVINRDFFLCLVFAMKSVQKLPNYPVLALCSILYSYRCIFKCLFRL